MEGNQLTTKKSLPSNHLRQDHVGHLQTRQLSEFCIEDNSVLNLKGISESYHCIRALRVGSTAVLILDVAWALGGCLGAEHWSSRMCSGF